MSNSVPLQQTKSIGKIFAKIMLYAVLLFVIFGPLSSLVIWSFAERWYWPNMFPSQWGVTFWQRAMTGNLAESFRNGIVIALITTFVVAVISVPLAYVLARYNIPFKRIILVLFLLPQAFPSLPIFSNLLPLFFRWQLAGTFAGVVLIHVAAAFIYSIWTMVSVFKSIPVVLEDASLLMGASRIKTFFTISLPLAFPGIAASSLLVFLFSLEEFTGTLLIGLPFITTLPVQLYMASMGFEMQIASVTSLIITIPGILLLVFFQRMMKAEYLSSFGRI